jgi:hypothetical protein
VLAISREGLALDGEQLIAVPGLDSSGDDAAAVAESCRRKLSPAELLAQLDERFEVLTGGWLSNCHLSGVESSGPQVSRRTPGNSRRWCTNSGGHRSFWATDKHSPDHQRAENVL